MKAENVSNMVIAPMDWQLGNEAKDSVAGIASYKDALAACDALSAASGAGVNADPWCVKQS